MACYTGDPNKRGKLRLVCNGVTYNYDISSSGKLETFILNMGSGSYTVSIWQQTEGTRYTQLFSQSFSVSLSSSLSPYLYPSRIVNYNAASAAVAKAKSLCVNARNDVQRVSAIYRYIIANVSYDYNKIGNMETGYVPNIDSTLSSRKGICYDYAALMACMLRSQGIPTQLITGNVAGGGYHAWNMVYVQNGGKITDHITAAANKYTLLDATYGAAKSDSYMAQFTAGGNYSVKYRY